jgi:hypothetical protein
MIILAPVFFGICYSAGVLFFAKQFFNVRREQRIKSLSTLGYFISSGMDSRYSKVRDPVAFFTKYEAKKTTTLCLVSGLFWPVTGLGISIIVCHSLLAIWFDRSAPKTKYEKKLDYTALLERNAQLEQELGLTTDE